MVGSRSLRHTSGSSGMIGEVQRILICLRASGALRSTRCRSSLLFVAASTCLWATAMALAWWLALRTVFKQDFGSLSCAAQIYDVGTRKPEVEFGSPIPKFSVLSHLRMSSRLVYGLSARTMICE